MTTDGFASRAISKSRLKARMLEIFREIEESGEDLVVTDHGRPVLRISPIRHQATVAELFGPFQGRLEFLEDPDAPTSDEWPTT